MVLARRRARQIAFLLGFEAPDQTRISTAVSEITRNAFVHAKGGRLCFCIADHAVPCLLIIELEDKGPGIHNIDQILSGQTDHLGLIGSSRLVDNFFVENRESGGALVRLEKAMAQRNSSFSATELAELANSLTHMVASNPIDEVHQQNQELLATLDEVSKKQAEVDAANLELAASNKHLSEANQLMAAMNNSLEEKVQKRTRELELTNHELSQARDEAILANKLKSQFVANISHEIRTPMSGILGSTELVLDGHKLDDETESLVRMTHDSAQSLMNIISDLLDFAKLEAGKPHVEEAPFYVSSLVDEVIESVYGAAKKKNLTIHESLDSKLDSKSLIGDPVLIRRSLLNLAHNAVKFTAEGDVRISVEVLEQANDIWKLKWTVSDTGIGIEEADKSRLFQPFVQADGSNTRKYGGTGLGLSISSGYIRLMGGEMGFKSEKKKGSEFWFTLPLRLAEQ